MRSDGGTYGLKGSAFLLLKDWLVIGDNPGMDLFSRTNKLVDAFIKIKSELDGKKEYDTEIQILATDLETVQKCYEDFAKVPGSEEWKKEYWIGLTSIQFRIWNLQRRSKIIDAQTQQQFKVPTDLRKLSPGVEDGT